MAKNAPDAPQISVSPNFRWLENGHILLWLIKDTCWASGFRPGGMLMILPTLAMAVFFLWKTRQVRAELFHNIAICLWIMANSVWMTGEFYKLDEQTKPVTVGLFVTGLILLLVYYGFFFAKDRKKEKEYTLTTKEEAASV
jgi:hypothetical protein